MVLGLLSVDSEPGIGDGLADVGWWISRKFIVGGSRFLWRISNFELGEMNPGGNSQKFSFSGSSENNLKRTFL